MRKVFLDSFSGAAADLKPGKRTPDDILAALAKAPRVSTWDMDAGNGWLWRGIKTLKERGWLTEVSEPYPWHRFALTPSGLAALRPNAIFSGGEAVRCKNLLGQQGPESAE